MLFVEIANKLRSIQSIEIIHIFFLKENSTIALFYTICDFMTNSRCELMDLYFLIMYVLYVIIDDFNLFIPPWLCYEIDILVYTTSLCYISPWTMRSKDALLWKWLNWNWMTWKWRKNYLVTHWHCVCTPCRQVILLLELAT